MREGVDYPEGEEEADQDSLRLSFGIDRVASNVGTKGCDLDRKRQIIDSALGRPLSVEMERKRKEVISLPPPPIPTSISPDRTYT